MLLKVRLYIIATHWWTFRRYSFSDIMIKGIEGFTRWSISNLTPRYMNMYYSYCLFLSAHAARSSLREWVCTIFTKCYLTMWRMCHGFCWAAHLDALLCVCRSLRNKLARVGNHSLLQQNPTPETATLNTIQARRFARRPPLFFFNAAHLMQGIALSFQLLLVWLGTGWYSLAKVSKWGFFSEHLDFSNPPQTCVCNSDCLLNALLPAVTLHADTSYLSTHLSTLTTHSLSVWLPRSGRDRFALYCTMSPWRFSQQLLWTSSDELERF